MERGRPRPKFTPVITFCPEGSRSRMTRPSQPSVAIFSGSQVCQMSMLRKWERVGFGYPMPLTMATLPSSHRALIGAMLGLRPSCPSSGITWSVGMPTLGRKS